MTKIFISGSREIPYLPEEARTRIDRMLASGFDIVVGDSERGVDANVIRYLDQAGYDNVSVYTVHERPRTAFSNPHWVLQKITPSIETKTDKAGRISNGRELETEKDKAMGEIADFGLIVWLSTYRNRFGKESVSKGSLRNACQLLLRGCPVVLYRAIPTESGDSYEFVNHELRSLPELVEMLQSEPEIVTRAFESIMKECNKQSSLF